MSRKIIGVTVGTALSPNKIREKLTPELTEAINTALKQAKESGEFDGNDGVGIESVDVPGDGTFEIHTSDGNITVITLPKGKDGISITDVNAFMQEDGTTTVEIYDENSKQLTKFDIPPGKDYVLTDTDKEEIAAKVEGLVVTVTGNTASHSSREIADYVKAGKNVVMKSDVDWYSFISYNEDIDCACFIQVAAMEGDHFVLAQVMGNEVGFYTMSNSGGSIDLTDYIELIPESSYPVSEEMKMVVLDREPTFIAGKTYLVKWNGVDYVCTAYKYDDEIVRLGSDELPFFIECFSESVDIYADDGSTSVTLAIYEKIAYATEEWVEKKLEEHSGGNVDFQVGETLKLENGILSVNTTNDMEEDNTLPITSAGVFATVGNIEALLKTI